MCLISRNLRHEIKVRKHLKARSGLSFYFNPYLSLKNSGERLIRSTRATAEGGVAFATV